jgi:hypothetical protein
VDVGNGPENLGAFLKVPDKESQGVMTIKRAGCTESIGKAARFRAGLNDITDLVALKAALHPPKAAELRKATWREQAELQRAA